MKLIAGLGNPGRAYSLTRHNIGYRTVKELAKDNGIDFRKDSSCDSLLARGEICGKKVVLLLPLTFMNSSGRAVSAVFYKEFEHLEDLMVVCDDISLPLGKIRIRKKGSSGGHKGLASVIESLGSKDFPRLRMGIATDLLKADIRDYVLSPFERRDKRAVSDMIERAKGAVSLWLEKGLDAAMNKFNPEFY